MTDKELIAHLRSWDGSPFDDDAYESAARIEELVKERDHAWRMVAESDARLGQSLGGNLLDKRKLAKAVEALKEIASYDTGATAGLAYTAQTVLAELEAKE